MRPGENDLLMLARLGPGEPKGHRPDEETVYQACGQLRAIARRRFNDRLKLLDRRFPVPVGCGFPNVRMGRPAENRWKPRTNPFTVGGRSRHREA